MIPRGRGLPQARRGPGWPLLVVLLVGVIALGVALFASLTDSLTGSDGEEPRRYVEALVGSPIRINPLFAYLNDVDQDLSSLVFSGLTRLGPRGEVLPDLAESWEISADGRTYTFHLRSDVLWHNGLPLTADDVVYTYGLLAAPDFPADPEQAALWRQVECTAPRDLTVQCLLPEPFAPFLSFTSVGILPKALLVNADRASLIQHPFNRAPVGTGPFRLVQMDGSRAVLVANSSYYLGEPQLDQVEFRFYPDTVTAAAALIRREVHGLFLGPTASQADFDALTEQGGLKSYAANGTAYTILYLNNSAPPFTDLRVRKAVAQAVDIGAIIDELLRGRAVRAQSPVVPGTWAFYPELKPYKYDPKTSRALLEEAGWLLPQGGQIRQRDGLDLRIDIMTDGDPLRVALAQTVAKQLAEVGIGATVSIRGASDLVRDFLLPRRYQAAIFGWDPGADPDPYPAWHSSQIGEQGRNLAAYLNAEADKILEEARRTADLSRRQALYYTFQQIFYYDVPSPILFYPVYTYFVRDEVQGIKLGTVFRSSSRFGNVHQWTVTAGRDLRGP